MTAWAALRVRAVPLSVSRMILTLPTPVTSSLNWSTSCPLAPADSSPSMGAISVALGALESIVTAMSLVCLTLPAASVMRAVNRCRPSLCAAVV